MKRKFPERKKRFLDECLNVILVLGIAVLAFLCDSDVLKIPNVFLLNVKNQEDLFFELFGVQATVATVGIAIIALLSGAVIENAYGICFSRFIADIKPVFLKHKFLLGVNLIITVMNYFVVSYSLFNVSIALFFISIVITIRLIRETYVIFLGKKEVKNNICEYILENYNSNIVEDLYFSLNEEIGLKKRSDVRASFEVIEKIFEKELSIQSIGGTLELIGKIEQLSEDTIVDILKRTDPQLTMLALDHVAKLYSVGNSCDPKYNLTLWGNIVPDFFSSLKNLTYTQLNDAGLFFGFHKQICYNIKMSDDNTRCMGFNELKYYSTWLYNTLKKSEYYDTFDIGRITKRLYDDIVMLYKYDEDLDEYQREALVSELCVYAKNLIDCGDYKSISKLYFDIGYCRDEEYKEFPLFVILIYLYYLICREPLVKNDARKSYAEQIVKENIAQIQFFLSTIDIVKMSREKLMFIRDLMDAWEIMKEGEMKTIIMDGVINDFFVLVSLENLWSEEDIMNVICNISPNNSFSMYSSYFTKDDKGIITLLSEFQTIFCSRTSSSDLSEKIDLLRNVLYEKYKTEEINAGRDEQITEEDKAKFTKFIEDEFKQIIKKNSSLLDSNITSQETITKNQRILNLGLWNLNFKGDSLDSYLCRALREMIITVFLTSLRDNIRIENVCEDDRNIQARFIRLVESSNVHGDTYLGNRGTFWHEENRNLLKEYVSSMDKVEIADGYRNLFILNSKLINFKCTNIKVEFEDLNNEEIEKDCKVDETGTVFYNVTNDIYIPFEKEELFEHVRRIKKNVRIYLEYAYAVDGIVGAGVHIEETKND